ncbi:hypothetical protein GGTG_03494 [Gaeumannomyces tritici R3-111a-1]|uniref:F-box domain-containing protein n=1 Tax=Gaeumannomyces tritici (strain R3-111a-1) TaxID=644352 RepID=J3NQD7_GAET3|nr:hypothetical protein GGTG_03494 [Gaeumannomyces tritici R3-111a-1]EJT78393.1 hypothetical protein GGTG_03494 [Gaeumannomyces tritici R3-111a-1]
MSAPTSSGLLAGEAPQKYSIFSPSTPVELVVEILSLLEKLDDLRNLILTCRYVHEVWKAQSSIIIWSVGQRAIAGFKEALEAVRATEMVKTALVRNLMPPTIDPETLCGAQNRPTAAELGTVVQFQHLVKCLEEIYRKGSYLPRMWLNRRQDGRSGTEPKNLPATDDEWERNYRGPFSRAIYRLLLAGAVLTPPHLRLLTDSSAGIPLKARDDLPDGLKGYISKQWQGDEAYSHTVLTRLAPFLQQVDAYNFPAGFEEQESLYGPLVDWMVPKRKANSIDMEPSVVETIRMAVAFHVLELAICNEDGSRTNDRTWCDPQAVSGLPKRVTVFIPGVHKLEEIALPADPKQCGLRLVSVQEPSAWGECGGKQDLEHSRDAVGDNQDQGGAQQADGAVLDAFRALDIAELKDRLFGRVGLNSYPLFQSSSGDEPFEQAPPPQVHFLAFALRRHFQMRISAAFFDAFTTEYLEFMTEGCFFSENWTWPEMETEEDEDVACRPEPDLYAIVASIFPMIAAEDADLRPCELSPIHYEGCPKRCSRSRWSGW